MVGSAIALGLGKLGFSVAVVEPNMPQPFLPEQAPDIRVSAISLTSEQLLTGLGAWSDIQKMRLCPYKRLSVWDKLSCRTDFDCASITQAHLGHIVENRVIQLGLHNVLAKYDTIQLFANDKVTVIESDHISKIQLASGQSIQARLLIGADGAQSKVRAAANIGVQGWQYAQQALGIQIQTSAPQQDIIE